MNLLYLGIFGALGALVLSLLVGLSFLPRGLVGVWIKVHLYSTNPACGSCCLYLPRETKEHYKRMLATSPAGCCAWFRVPPVLSDQAEALSPDRRRGLSVSIGTETRRVSISGVPLGLIPPPTPTGAAVDLVTVRADAVKKRRMLRHHVTRMLPRDDPGCDSACGFSGFGEANNPEEGVTLQARTNSDGRDNEDEPTQAQFVLALLDAKGGWVADLNINETGLQLGKETPIGPSTQLGEVGGEESNVTELSCRRTASEVES